MQVTKMDTQSDHNIVVSRGADRRGQYTWSPFVTKLEFRLRFSKLSYDVNASGPLQGPRGKIPHVEISTPGKSPERIGDTSLIIKNFIGKGLLPDLDAGLSVKDAGFGLAVRAMLEDKLFFYNIRERWIDNYYTMRDYTLAKVPFPQRYLFGYLVHRAVTKKLLDQGTGRFSDDEIHEFRKEIWTAVNGILEESQRKRKDRGCFWVLGGDLPTEVDATVYGFAVSALVSPAGPVSRQLVKAEYAAVVEYATRIHEKYFPDYELWE